MDNKTEAIRILELAGFKVIEHKRGFNIRKDDKPLCGYSSSQPLNPVQMMLFIKEQSFNKGFQAGQENLKKKFKELMLTD